MNHPLDLTEADASKTITAVTSKNLLAGLAIVLACLGAAPSASAQSKGEYAAWITVVYGLGTASIAGSGYALAMDGQCAQWDGTECIGRFTRADWQVGLLSAGIVLGAGLIAIATWLVADTRTYTWRYQTLAHVSLEPVLEVGLHGGSAGLRVRW